LIVAIDGPAASGKSTVAKAVARALGARYVDTGAMYRAAAWAVLDAGADLSDEAAVAEVARGMDLILEQPASEPWEPPVVKVGDTDVTLAIRSPKVNAAVSPVAKVSAVRREMVHRQRELVGDGDAVVEGRDIGTVVFPDAEVKVFLTADPDERIRRRKAELEEQGVRGADESHARVLDRDRIDSSRSDSPLTQAEDATRVDTTDLDVGDVVGLVLGLVDGVPGAGTAVAGEDPRP
jgi:pantoate ligase/cytidylate kinase